jgi:hypothetical protein
MWNTGSYATGYALCDSPMGPCRKTGSRPVIDSDGEMAGPGGGEVFTDLDGGRWLAYHAWHAGVVGYRRGGVRSLRLERVSISGGTLIRNALLR